LKLKLGK